MNISRLSYVTIAVLLMLSYAVGGVAHAATLKAVAGSASFEVGVSYTLTIQVSTPDQAMNAVAGTLRFPSDAVQVTSLSKSGSVVGVWVQEPSFSNSAGTVTFEGIVLNPGYTGSGGRVLSVTLRALKPGSATFSFSDASVLANDGNGTEILEASSGLTISITPAVEQPRRAAPPPAPMPATPTPTPAQKPEPTEPPVFEMPKTKTSIEKPYDFSGLWSWADTPARSATFAIFLLLILFFLVLDAIFLYLRLTRVGGISSSAEKVTHRSFLILNDDVDRYLDELQDLSGTRKLSSLEKRFVREMKGDLATAEKDISREIRRSQT